MGSNHSMENIQATATIAKELLESGSSATAKALSKKTDSQTSSHQNSQLSVSRINTNCQQQPLAASNTVPAQHVCQPVAQHVTAQACMNQQVSTSTPQQTTANQMQSQIQVSLFTYM